MLCGKVVSHFGICCELSQLGGRRIVLPNISRAEKMALKEIKTDPNLIISRPDNDCCTVLMNYSSYRPKMLNILSDADTFEIARKDLTETRSRELIRILTEISNVGLVSR
ncbi:hypothetical protein GJ496_003238 [Pomphorhynchus laevis]|nr:hypothetical protein GJ496_003238 [Pomphorhynchus laevis]